MERLSTPLLCLTLQHVIDQPDAVEGLLREYPQIERCIPLTLKEVFSMPTIPDALTTSKYVLALWYMLPKIQDTKRKYLAAAEAGLVYLLPYIDPHPHVLYTIQEAMWAAIKGRQLETLKYLLSLIVPNTTSFPIVQGSLTVAGRNGDIDAVKYILLWMSSNYSPEQVNTAISHVLIELTNAKWLVQMGIHGNVDAITAAEIFLSSMLNHPEKWKS